MFGKPQEVTAETHMQRQLSTVQVVGAAKLANYEAAAVMVRQIRQFSGVGTKSLHEASLVRSFAMQQRCFHHVAGDAVLGEAHGVGAQDIRHLLPVQIRAVLHDVLDHEISEGVPAELLHFIKHFHDDVLDASPWEVLDQPLEDTAAVAVPGDDDRVASHFFQDEVDMLCRQRGDALLQHVVCMGRGCRLQNTTMQLLSHGHLARDIGQLERFLNYTAAAGSSRQTPKVCHDRLENGIPCVKVVTDKLRHDGIAPVFICLLCGGGALDGGVGCPCEERSAGGMLQRGAEDLLGVQWGESCGACVAAGTTAAAAR